MFIAWTIYTRRHKARHPLRRRALMLHFYVLMPVSSYRPPRPYRKARQGSAAQREGSVNKRIPPFDRLQQKPLPFAQKAVLSGLKLLFCNITDSAQRWNNAAKTVTQPPPRISREGGCVWQGSFFHYIKDTSKAGRCRSYCLFDRLCFS